MRLVETMILIGLVLSAAAAGYTTVQFTWWSLGLATLSTAIFWLAFCQVRSRRRPNRQPIAADDWDTADRVYFDPMPPTRRVVRQCDFDTRPSHRQDADRQPAPTEFERPAA